MVLPFVLQKGWFLFFALHFVPEGDDYVLRSKQCTGVARPGTARPDQFFTRLCESCSASKDAAAGLIASHSKSSDRQGQRKDKQAKIKEDLKNALMAIFDYSYDEKKIILVIL